jgi:hypothetical protein
MDQPDMDTLQAHGMQVVMLSCHIDEECDERIRLAKLFSHAH